MVERLEINIRKQAIAIKPLVAVRQKAGTWCIKAEVTFSIVVGKGRRVVGTQIVKMTRGTLSIDPGEYKPKGKVYP